MNTKFKIGFAKEEDTESLVNLSKLFSEENCCNNIIPTSEKEFKKKTVFICRNHENIIGYCYGMIGEQHKTTSYLNKNENYFEIEEIYILPQYRNRGLGEKLFKSVEKYAKKEDCKAVILCAVSKNYTDLLNFYINKLHMKFISAFLVKRF